jgi:glycosyltransferase involved in cell wall biosynthesis
LTTLAFCIPGDIDLPTGGYRYDREVLARIAGQGVQTEHLGLGSGFPHPSDDDIARAFAVLRGVNTRSVLLIDGLALGALPPAAVAALPHKTVALVHHPLGLEAGLTAQRSTHLMENERAVLAHMRHVIVTSPATKRILLQDFGLADRKVSIAEPGTARQHRATGTGQPLQVLAVGAVSPRKAYGHLVEAMASMTDVDWRLTIAGSLTLASDAVKALRTAIDGCGCADRITLTGALDEAQLAACFDRADVFAMSSLFEGYGMALTEALARGLPIVTSTGGAAAETVPDMAALKLPPGDATALSAALRKVMTDHAFRRRMADAAWAAAALLPTWDDTARDVADVIKSV